MKKCFVISPIGEDNSTERAHADKVLTAIIQPAMETVGMDTLRADHLEKPGKITDQMFSEIFKADLCVVILTFRNPNVFYELAIAQSIGKPIIILISDKEELPFDIRDIRCIYYDMERDSFEPVITKIINYVKALEKENWAVQDIFEPYRRYLGSFISQDTVKTHLAVKNFCNRVKGYWLTYGTQYNFPALGIVEFVEDEFMNSLSFFGRAYDSEGRLIATWQTIASCINLKQKRIYYYWEGDHSDSPGDRYEGFGEVTFFDSANELFQHGKDEFFDKNLSDIKSATMKRSDLRRCTEEQVLGIRSGNNVQWIAELVQKGIRPR